jgi:membrane-bound ClpP family serine protease
MVAAATIGTAAVGGYSLLQTFAGRSRFDTPPASAALLALGVACLAVPVVMVGVAAIGGRGSQTEAPSSRGG